ncbi:ABC transporter ATP-binding protein [Aestuariivirga sp.]|uniref:ABC transporter ATP-binding protein n=1 Tax=Aestuariivirga sp. TaxID=2650926 RepID=UPI00359392D0
MAESQSAIEARGVTKEFAGGVTALDRVFVTIRENEFFTLLGPSGCGKTTLLRLIAGFEYPTEGEILLHGQDIAHLPPDKRPVNTVFQHYALFPHMTVAENVGFGLRMLGKSAAEIAKTVKESLALVKMADYGARKPSQLSGGQQQRVAFARALAPHPKVLLLDEPLSALDLKLRQAMRGELKTLQRETGITFVFVTHDQEEALTMSDRIAVMSAGKVQQIGAPHDVYESPVNHFVADFIGDTNFVEGQIEKLAGDESIVRVGEGFAIETRLNGPHKTGDKVSVALRPEKIMLKMPGAASLSGTVRDAVYVGTGTTYAVALPHGVTVNVRDLNSLSGQGRFAVGETVSVDIPAGAARMLAD